MRTFILTSILLSASLIGLLSCEHAPKTELPKPEIITPVTPKDVIDTPVLSAEFKDVDCGQMVPAGFNEKVDAEVIKRDTFLKYKNNRSYWVSFFYSLAKAESCFGKNTRLVEKGLGKDIVTKQQNTSEGYFQMSYQDKVIHGCNFDWNVDKNKAVKDLTKTIFDTNAQIECAVIVMEKQIKTKGTIYSRYYWSVLDPKDNKKFLGYMKKLGY